jgi:hypothetical protein
MNEDAVGAESIGWYAGRVYCAVCEAIHMLVWPNVADEHHLQCVSCKAQESVVVTRILTAQATHKLWMALKS